MLYPVVPLAQRQALGIAVMSYDGHLGFGLLGDYDALPDLEAIARDLKWAIASLCRAAGVRAPARTRRQTRRSRASDGKAAASSKPRAERSALETPRAEAHRQRRLNSTAAATACARARREAPARPAGHPPTRRRHGTCASPSAR